MTMEWTISIEGRTNSEQSFVGEVRIDKSDEHLRDGDLGLSIDDGKKIMATLQAAVVTIRAKPTPCSEGSARIARPLDQSRTIRRAAFGTVEVRNPRWLLCRDCHPGMDAAFASLKEICPDRATPKLMELTARLGSMMPYRQAATMLAQFLPVEPTETHATVRKRTIRIGQRLDEQITRESCARAEVDERRQLEMRLPGDRRKEFVISIDTASVRCAEKHLARKLRDRSCRYVRGGRGDSGGRHLTTSHTRKHAIRDRAVTRSGKILKRLPRAMPKPTTHIIDWFQIAMKVQSMQQIADHIVRSRSDLTSVLASIDRDIRAVEVASVARASGSRDPKP